MLCLVSPLFDFSLRDWLESSVDSKSASSSLARIAQATCVGADLSKGLCHLHSLHVAHRDLKPENVLMNRGKCVSKRITIHSQDHTLPGCTSKRFLRSTLTYPLRHAKLHQSVYLCTLRAVADFGASKVVEAEPGAHSPPSCCYVCTSYYRAPELLWGASEYTFSPECVKRFKPHSGLVIP